MICLLISAAAASDLQRHELGLTAENLNKRVLAAEYAVRGRLLDRAVELESAGQQVVRCNIGNPQALGQLPLRWIRSVLSLCINPSLLEACEEALKANAGNDALGALFPLGLMRLVLRAST